VVAVSGPRTCREGAIRLTSQWRELAALVVTLLDRGWPDGPPVCECGEPTTCAAPRVVAARALDQLGHADLVSQPRFVMVENAVRRWMNGAADQ
jgi:hypothetical protein